ncbi:MAG TPA: EAL domain-containing protein [Allosphingosinicella sp.]|nr:EAL domain-containing protein [Allosphingosinicella sp.]
MRKGRFASLSIDAHAPEPLLFGPLTLFDLRVPASEDDAQIAGERVRLLAGSIPFLAGSHLLWSLTLLGLLFLDTGALPLAGLPLAGLLVLDIALLAMIRRPMASHRKARLVLLYLGASAMLLGAAGHLVGAQAPLLAQAAMIAALSAGIASFFLFPLLLIVSCAVTIGGILLMTPQSPFLPVAAAASLLFGVLSVGRARDLIFSAQQQLAAQWEAMQAGRFIEEFEGTGRGWFWETNADGQVTYLSEALAAKLDLAKDGAIGTRFEELLLVRGGEGSDDARRSLGFHLAARFPFNDLVVRAPTCQSSWWSLSGTPQFDECGRFLGFRGIGANLSDQLRSEAEQTKLARYDSLTGLPNRVMMRATLDDALANAAARRQGCALMMLDLDRFKQVNDTLGHPVGDLLLKQVAARLRDTLGDDGRAGRVGGDEFEAIFPGIAEEARLAEIAARIITEISRPYDLEGNRVEIGTSVGIVVARPGKAYAAALIKEADLALYAAKAAGRGTFRFFAEEMHAEAAERQILENDLRDSLTKGQLRILYQPIVDAVTEEPVAFEALLRWQHPTRGLLLPADFLGAAEECALMPRLGAWVLREACSEAAKWPGHVRIAVNLSPAQVADPGLASVVTGALASAGLAPDRLELEIGESAFPADGDGPARILSRLKSLGVRLALDNFGTGRSGLGHLRDAPLDKIKIDRSFVRGAEAKGSRNAAIIRAIVVLGESLGMDTTAEGAETLEELALIRSLGCSQVQGFLFGKAVPGAEAAALAATSRPTAEVVGFSRPPRHKLLRNGLLEYGGESLQVRLRNISGDGAMVECERPLPEDAEVVLDLEEAGRIPAVVRWCQRGQAGLRFAQPFELRKLSRTRPGPAGLKMLTPDYLELRPEAPAPGPSPLVRKKSGGR